MKQHQYQITLTHTADADGNPITNQSLTFSAPNHDDLFPLLEKVAQMRPELDEQSRTRFLVGLKLLGEVCLENKDHEFFSQFTPHIKEMMMILKGRK